MEVHHAFGKALKKVRKKRGLTQEDFSLTSSRTYVSSLERGLKSPTLDKVDELAFTLGIHPLTLLLLAYASPASFDGSALLSRVAAEAEELAATPQK